jgi:hypothetical protein
MWQDMNARSNGVISPDPSRALGQGPAPISQTVARSAGTPILLLIRAARSSSPVLLVSLGLRGNGDDDLSVSAFVRDRSTVRGGSLIQGNGGFDECSKVSGHPG